MTEPRKQLTPENYSKGFLIDGELIAGVAPDANQPGQYLAFVLKHLTGEPLGAHRYETLAQALDAVNRIPRSWEFESAGACGGGKCGEGGSCGGGRCGAGGCCPA